MTFGAYGPALVRYQEHTLPYVGDTGAHSEGGALRWSVSLVLVYTIKPPFTRPVFSRGTCLQVNLEPL